MGSISNAIGPRDRQTNKQIDRQINRSTEIEPERQTVIETETGRQAGRNIFVNPLYTCAYQ